VADSHGIGFAINLANRITAAARVTPARLSARRLPRQLLTGRPFLRLHTTKTVGLPHARGHGELYGGVA